MTNKKNLRKWRNIIQQVEEDKDIKFNNWIDEE
jgi:hypothetical protein